MATINSRNFVITGGTGFAGRWLLTILNTLILEPRENQILVITRNSSKGNKYPKHMKFVNWGENIEVSGNVDNHIEIVCFHAGVPAASGETIKVEQESEFSSRLVSLIDDLFDLVQSPIVINLSSGGVYKRPKFTLISEDEDPMKQDQFDAYRRVKYADENALSNYALKSELVAANPRLFSFTGPGLSIPGHYALSNFIGQALKGKAVEVLGNPQSRRSYMSPLDMAIWLLKCSIYPTLDTLHIGSDESYSMEEIAVIVSRKFGNGQVILTKESTIEPESYVPEITKTMSRIRVCKPMELEDSLDYWMRHFEN